MEAKMTSCTDHLFNITRCLSLNDEYFIYVTKIIIMIILKQEKVIYNKGLSRGESSIMETSYLQSTIRSYGQRRQELDPINWPLPNTP